MAQHNSGTTGSNKFKTVSSHQNLGAYQQVEVTRVVSERTVCYCSNFDLSSEEWFQIYKNIQAFSQSLRCKLGKSFFFIQICLAFVFLSHSVVDETWHLYFQEAATFPAQAN